MIRAVLDTNIIASGLKEFGGAPARIMYLWTLDTFRLVTSEHILKELEGTLTKPYFQQNVSRDRIDRAVIRLRTRGILVPLPGQLRGIASHVHDDPVLETAVVGRADVLVTGDRALRRLGLIDGIPIIGPIEFLDLLGAEL